MGLVFEGLFQVDLPLISAYPRWTRDAKQEEWMNQEGWRTGGGSFPRIFISFSAQ